MSPSLCFVKTETEKAVVVAGGYYEYEGNKESVHTVEVFNLKKREWKRLPDLKVARY